MNQAEAASRIESEFRRQVRKSRNPRNSFWPLMEELVRDPSMRMTPREAVEWGKRHLTPKSKPGDRHLYTDTNYYLLGLVVESITKKPFHDALHRLLFDPLGMESAYMQGYSQPKVESKLPPAGPFINGVD